ncbi:2-deoxyglucose-6-phosphate phosphatase [Entamoeba marina]
MSGSPSIKYAIFDLDGTILDTEIMYTIATQQYLDEYANGAQFTYEAKKEMMGRHIDVATKNLLDIYHINDTVEHAVQYKIDHLNALNTTFPIALATSTTKPVFDVKMSHNEEILDYFDAIVCGDDPNVTEAKPNPAIFLHAAKLLGCTDMKTAIVFEDAVLGVEAGLRSGAYTIAIPDEKNAADPYFQKAHEVLHSLKEFKPKTFGLPEDY